MESSHNLGAGRDKAQQWVYLRWAVLAAAGLHGGPVTLPGPLRLQLILWGCPLLDWPAI